MTFGFILDRDGETKGTAALTQCSLKAAGKFGIPVLNRWSHTGHHKIHLK
jgi:hypothetical protein